MLSALKDYLLANPLPGVLTSPLPHVVRAWALVPIFAAIALPLGFSAGLFRWEAIAPQWAPLLALALLISPAFLEELVFRGLLIPRDILKRGRGRAALAIVFSALVYTLSHPLGALTTSPGAKPFFLNPTFVLIIALLGVTCGYGYVVSRSLWNPILIHWLALLVWIFFLGGYDLVLALEGDVWGLEPES